MLILTNYRANTIAGSDRWNRSRGWLRHTVIPSWRISSQAGCRRSVTTSHVLKYSLNCVISPSFNVQTWTQYTWAPSQPSATITESPIAVMLLGSNRNSPWLDSPVRIRIMYWQCGGPWNHHSRSAARNLATAWVRPAARDL